MQHKQGACSPQLSRHSSLIVMQACASRLIGVATKTEVSRAKGTGQVWHEQATPKVIREVPPQAVRPEKLYFCQAMALSNEGHASQTHGACHWEAGAPASGFAPSCGSPALSPARC